MLVDLTEWEAKVLRAEFSMPHTLGRFLPEAYKKRDALLEKLNNMADNFNEDYKSTCKPEITNGGHLKISDDLLLDIFIKKFLSKDDVNTILDVFYARKCGMDPSLKQYKDIKDLELKLRKLYPEVEK